jgi:hypothetical protein
MIYSKKITRIGLALLIIVYLLIGSITAFAEADFEAKPFGPGTLTETIATYGENEEITLTAYPHQGSYFKGWVFLEGYFDYEQDIYDEHTIYLFGPSERIVMIAVFGTDNSILLNDVLCSANNITVNLSEVLEGITSEGYIIKSAFTGVNVKTDEDIAISEIYLTHDVLPYPGKYPASFSNQVILGNSSVDIEVEVVDDIPPVIEAKSQMTIDMGTDNFANFTELFRVTAVDGVDGDITKLITYDAAFDEIDFNIPGSYVVTARVEDAAGNAASKELSLTILEADVDSSTPDNNSNDNNNYHNDYKSNYPKTGDEGYFGSIVMLIISLAVIAVAFGKRKQSSKKTGTG